MSMVSLDPSTSSVDEFSDFLDRFIPRLPARVKQDRRKMDRVAIPFLICVTPLSGPGGAPIGETVAVVGKDLSRAGIGLFHQQPLPHRHVRLTFEDPRLERLSVEVELNRCRFSNLGWYESGGRLIDYSTDDLAASLAG